MTKGKYAAKAKNRLANLDNELLQDVIAERDALKMELDAERLKVQAAERLLHSRALRLASQMSSEEMATLKAELAESAKRFAEETKRRANAVFRLFDDGKMGGCTYEGYTRLAEILGVGDMFGELIAPGDASRHTRRATAKKARGTEGILAGDWMHRARPGQARVGADVD